jgi:hypothetical protein
MSLFYIGITTVAVSAIGTGVSVYQQNQAADAAEDAAAFNAKLNIEQARSEREVAGENARRKASEEKRMLASIVAATAGAGFAMEGTPLAIFGDAAQQLERDVLDIGFAAQTRERALMSGAVQSMYEGQNQATALRNQSIATGIQGVSSALGGYYNANKGGYLT